MLCQKRSDNLRVHVGDLADKAQVYSVLVDFLRAQKARVNSAKAHRPSAFLKQNADNVLVELSGQNHFDNFHRLGVSVSQAVNELAFLSDALKHLVYLGPAAVNQDDVHADCRKQNNVFHYSGLKVFVEHRVSAVLNDDGFSDPLLKVRKRLDQDAGPAVVVKPGVNSIFFFFHNKLSSTSGSRR